MGAGIAFCCHELPPLAGLEREWCALEAVAQVSFFVSWAWIGTMLDTIPPERRPRLLRGKAGGETVALAVLGVAATRRRHGLVRSRGLYLNETGDPQCDAMTIEHNGLLTAPENQGAALAALFGWFARQRLQADELYLSGLPFRLAAAAVASHGLLLSETAALSSYAVELDRLSPGRGGLAAVISGNSRQQLRRAFRHYAAQGSLTVREAESETEAQRWFTALRALHCASWERRRQPHSFANPFFERFHRRLIERCFAAGGVQMIEARAGERVIGYLYNFRHGRRIYAYQSGFDDADPRERPGYVTHALAIRHAFEQGMQIYDFMAGRNRLKESFATSRTAMLWQVVQQPRLRFRLEHLGRRLKHLAGLAKSCFLPQDGPEDRASRV
jgi:CelD/BcsL family acetyltransferase involved in cellulose biosynthesis